MSAYRARWWDDATGCVARYAGQYADTGPTTDLDGLTAVVRAMPNGGQIEVVELAEGGAS